MENTMVSARVPAGKKQRVSGILASLGATTSDMINGAIDYVIATKQLPSADALDAHSAADRRNADGFAAFVAASTLEIDWPSDETDDYQALMRKQRLADYESLA